MHPSTRDDWVWGIILSMAALGFMFAFFVIGVSL